MKQDEIRRQLGEIFYDTCPYAAVVFDNGLKVIHGNESAVRLFGFESREMLIADLDVLLEKGMPAFQSNASPTVPLKKRLEYAFTNGSIDFETEIVIAETRLYLRISLRKVALGASVYIIGYFTDIRDLKQSQTDLFKQEYLLRQINRVATLLSDASLEGMDTTLTNVLKIAAESVEAERICIYKNDDGDTAAACTVALSWSGGYMDKFPQEIKYDRIADAHAKLIKNRSINKTAAELSPDEKELFAAAGTKSVLIIPLFLFGKFWGILILDNRKNDRIYTRMESSAVQSAGILIISSLIRNDTYKQLVLAKDAAQASDRAKMEFLSRMSHEIRTPLNAIIGMTALSKRDVKDENAKEKLDKIEFASSQLLHIINDILDMSKIESGKLEMNTAEFDFNELIGNITSMMRVQSDAKNQTLECRVPRLGKKICCDDLHLKQIIVNLLSNAIKFTPANGRVTVSAGVQPIDNTYHSLNVSVSDTGIGISDENVRKLFTSFEQADGGIARKFGGTGLGLAISKQLCLLMGGDISVTSSEGKGSTFSFHVPFTFGGMTDKKDGDEKVIKNKPHDWKDKHMLLVEDTAINSEIVIELLRDTSISIDVAENGLIALHMFKAHPGKYDIILMDVQMPEMDGLEATRRIRASGGENAKAVPIVAMTANAFSGDVKNCLDAGMNGHISKPIDIDILFKKLGEYI